MLELEITNGSGAPFTVTNAAFESSRFATVASWKGPQLMSPGSATDLRVKLADPVCDGVAPRDRIVIDFTLADGSSGSVTVTPTDEQGRVDAVNAQDCLGVSVARIASISAPAQIGWTPGAHQPAVIAITVVPTGAAGTITIQSAKETVLLSLTEPRGGPLDELKLDRVVNAAAGSSVISLAVVPARCDAHAIEEDKRGTFFPLEIQTDDSRSGTIYVGMPDEARRSLYEFYSNYCGLP